MKVQVSVPCDRTKPQDYSILRIREAVSKFAVVLYLMKRRREKEKREREPFFFSSTVRNDNLDEINLID